MSESVKWTRVQACEVGFHHIETVHDIVCKEELEVERLPAKTVEE